MPSHIKDLLIILSPLIIGSLLPINKPIVHKLIEKTLNILVYLILFLMGIGLGQIPNLFQEIGTIFISVLCFIFVLHFCNILALWHYGKKYRSLAQQTEGSTSTSFFSMILFSLKLIGVVILGFILGYFTQDLWHFDNHISNYVLMLLLLLIGIQLRNSGFPLRQILLNKQGIITAVLFFASSLVGGIICALLLGLPIYQGLAIASGSGWYSLSGLILQESLGPVLGSIAFLNDMGREFIAFLFIPILMRYSPCTSVGIGGATSLDFTLPIIQRSGGLSIVPVAISFGFLVNLIAPVLLLIFSRLAQ